MLQQRTLRLPPEKTQTPQSTNPGKKFKLFSNVATERSREESAALWLVELAHRRRCGFAVPGAGSLSRQLLQYLFPQLLRLAKKLLILHKQPVQLQ
jgi:hypothetical protein